MPTISAVHLLTGAGLVQRHGDTVVAVDDPSDDQGFATAVLRDCRELSGSDLVRRLAGRVLNLAPADGSRLGVVTTAGDGPLVFLHGDIELRTADGVVSGADLVTGIEIALGAVDSLAVVPGGVDHRGDERTDLTAGVVAASGFHLDVAAFPPPTVESARAPEDDAVPDAGRVAPPPVHVAEMQAVPTGPEPTVVLSPVQGGIESEEVDGVVDGDVVHGVRCPADHHNDPRAVFCAQCGLKLGAHRTLRPVLGPRPQLGVLVLDDGTTVPVARDLVLGREPDEHDLVTQGAAVAVELSDPEQTVSRVHAHVVLEGWDVHVADLGSANGTFVRLRPDSEWVEVSGADRIRLPAGAMVRLGDRELVFASHDVLAEQAS